MPMSEETRRTGLRARLRELVAETAVGQRLPGERDLSAAWGVARMTLRRAVDSLVAEGLIERRRGSGTYVRPQSFVRLLGLTSFSQDMLDRGLVPGSQLLAFQSSPASASLAAQLQVPVGDRVVSFSRLRLGGSMPMAVETVWISDAIVPGISERDLDGSLYELLRTRHGIAPGSAKVTIEPLLPDARIRELLTIGPDLACLRMRMIDYDSRGRVLMIANCVYRGDQYQLSADISGGAFTSAAVRRAG